MLDKKRIKDALPFYLFISPWLIGFLLLVLGPMMYSLYASFTNWNGINAPIFTGIKNFRDMFLVDDLFWKSVRNTFYYAFVSVPLNLVIALTLAVLLNKKRVGTYFFRAVFYLPTVIAGVAIFIVWAWMFESNMGLFNYLLSIIGVQGPKWLVDSRWAMISIILMSITFCGGAMLIFLAGLQDIPKEYIEAAQVDGSSKAHTFFKIVLPLLSPTLFFNLIMGVIGSLQVFSQPFIMTNGGPMYSTYVYSIHLYNSAFRYFKFGYASALAWTLFLIILILSLFIINGSKKLMYLEGDE